MPELGLFPLAIVLLPTERVPLHIFEPRYRELIEECLHEGKEFGISYTDGEGAVAEVGTRAMVVEVLERLEDGRVNVIAEGRERFRLLELTHGREFQTGSVEEIVDDGDAAEPEAVERALVLFRRLAEIAGAPVDEPAPGPALSFALGARVDFGIEPKQKLLESTSEPERLELVSELLEKAAETLATQHELQNRASSNGRVHPSE